MVVGAAEAAHDAAHRPVAPLRAARSRSHPAFPGRHAQAARGSRGLSRVIVVGGGNAALCAAIAAREAGADVTVLERAPFAQRGGNSRFTAGGMRVAYDGVGDLKALMPDLSAQELARADFGAYPRAEFYDDMGRVTQYRTDPSLAAKLIDDSLPTLSWMAGLGVRFLPMYGRQSFERDGKARFWGGLTVEAWGGGPGLVDGLTDIALRLGVAFRYGARAQALSMAGWPSTTTASMPSSRHWCRPVRMSMAPRPWRCNGGNTPTGASAAAASARSGATIGSRLNRMWPTMPSSRSATSDAMASPSARSRSTRSASAAWPNACRWTARIAAASAGTSARTVA